MGEIPVTLLLIEDDPAIRKLMKRVFQGTRFSVVEAKDGAEGIQAAARKNPDAIVLDVGLPDMDGPEVIEEVRQWSQVPIIVLSGDPTESTKVECLKAGADDYVTKPFGADELEARIEAVLRRVQAPEDVQPILEAAGLKLDVSAYTVHAGEERVGLTKLEFKLLAELMRHAGKVVTHTDLLTRVWGPGYAEDTQNLRVYVGYLRKKLAEVGLDDVIQTEPHVGYRIVD